jgi:hypothetical protein
MILKNGRLHEKYKLVNNNVYMPYKDPEARKAYQKKYEAENDEHIKMVQGE